MGSIQVLSALVANQIAAGEVVERPASVVKELVENALDARATRVVVDVENGGMSKIQITDDGAGMDSDDVNQSVVRHATSKVKTVDDLMRIATMGFRGEALASIASVSKMQIRSRMSDQSMSGYSITLNGGEVIAKGNVGMAGGTTVSVEDLFFNVPARKKFLKTAQTELRQIAEVVESVAMAFPNVSFRLNHGNRKLFEFPKNQTRWERLREVLGATIADQLIKIQYDHPHLQIEGWVGKPQTGVETKVRQFLLVNQRRVSDRTVAGAVKQALGSLLMPRAQVPWVIYVNMPNDMVDVNVHPRKEEVQFVNGNTIFRAVMDSVQMAFQKQDLRYIRGESGDAVRDEVVSSHMTEDGDLSTLKKTSRMETHGWVSESAARYEPRRAEFRGGSDFKGGLPLKKFESQSVMNTPVGLNRAGSVEDFLEQALPWEQRESEMTADQEIIQLQNLYLVLQTDKGMRLIDQHAAHERIRYEQLLAGWEHKDRRTVQPLLVPEEIALSAKELLVIEENLEALRKVGFEVEIVTSDNEKDVRAPLTITAIPAILAGVRLGQLIQEMIGDLLTEDEPESLRKYPDEKVDSQTRKMLTYMACRSAIKGGEYLSMQRRRLLLQELATCTRPYTCPHGRPVEIVVTWGELERMFKRQV